MSKSKPFEEIKVPEAYIKPEILAERVLEGITMVNMTRIALGNIHHVANLSSKLGHDKTRELLEIMADCIDHDNLEDFITLALRLQGAEVIKNKDNHYACSNCGNISIHASKFCNWCGSKLGWSTYER